jgi:hypothetical protein
VLFAKDQQSAANVTATRMAILILVDQNCGNAIETAVDAIRSMGNGLNNIRAECK